MLSSGDRIITFAWWETKANDDDDDDSDRSKQRTNGGKKKTRISETIEIAYSNECWTRLRKRTKFVTQKPMQNKEENGKVKSDENKSIFTDMDISLL